MTELTERALAIADAAYLAAPPDANGMHLYLRTYLSALAAIDAAQGGAVPKVTICATEGCENPATVHFERGGVGSDYCHRCYLKIQSLSGA